MIKPKCCLAAKERIMWKYKDLRVNSTIPWARDHDGWTFRNFQKYQLLHCPFCGTEFKDPTVEDTGVKEEDIEAMLTLRNKHTDDEPASSKEYKAAEIIAWTFSQMVMAREGGLALPTADYLVKKFDKEYKGVEA